MQLELTDDQQFFVETTRRYLEDRYPSAELRATRDDEAGFDQKYWLQGAELGWTSPLVDESEGGGSISGQGVSDLALIAFEFGRHASPGPLLGTNVVAAAVSRWGSDEQKAALLPGLLTGELIGAWAFAEPAPNDRLGAVTCRATPLVGGDGFRLSGRKAPVEAAGQADHIIVAAQTPEGLANFLVPAGAPGLSVTPMRSLDVTRRYASGELADVEVPSSARLGGDGLDTGEVQNQQLLQVALVIQLSEMVGALDRCLEMTIDWAFDRYSFGRPLSSYQALKHRFADMRSWLEAAHAIADTATVHVQDGSPRADEYLSAAKAFIGSYGPEMAHDCVQIHGGIGVTFDHDLHLFLRRIVIGARLLGTVSDHRQRLTSILESEVAS